MSDLDSAKRRDDIMRKVAAMLAKADSTTFGDERDAFIAKADQLMSAYAIEAFELEFRKSKTERRKPELRVIEYGTTGDKEADDEMVQIFYQLAGLVGVKLGFWGWKSAKAVGYSEDLDYLTMLFFNVRLHLATQLEPKPDPTLSMEENLVMLKEAGMKWERIYQLLHAAGQLDDPWERKVGVRFTGIYTRYCKENNRPRMYTNPDVWRRNFIQGYRSGIEARIWEMKAAREQAASGHELVLASMADELLEALYEFFPERRPHPKDCQCDTCHVCYDPKCNRPNCRARRAPIKYSRARTVRELKYDAAAQRAGKATAQNADLGSSRGAGPSTQKGVN